MPKHLIGLAIVFLTLLPAAADDPPAKKAPDDEIKKLIDRLAEVSDSDTGYSATTSGYNFLPFGWRQFGAGLLFQKPSVESDTMARLVEIGAPAVPHLAAHVGDQRPTGITLRHEGFFGSMSFEDGYDFNGRTTPKPKGLPDRDSQEHVTSYTVKVGDLCFVALGQIVNRGFTAVRYQPTANIMLSSPTHNEVLRKIVAEEWGKLTPEAHKASLVRDMLEYDRFGRAIHASIRLAYYYPEAHEAAALRLLVEPTYPESEVREFVKKTLLPAKSADRKALLDALVAKYGRVVLSGVEGELFQRIDYASAEGRDSRDCLVELFGHPRTVAWRNEPKNYSVSDNGKAEFIETLAYSRSDKVAKAVRDLFVKAEDNYLARTCTNALVGRGYDADIQAYLKRQPPPKEEYEREARQAIEERLGWTRMHQAIDLGSVELVRRDLKANVPADARARDGQTALHFAAAKGQEAIVDALLAARADVGIKDKKGRLAVQITAFADHPGIVRKLVEKGSEVPDVFVAATVGKTDRLAEILKSDPTQVKARNGDGLTPLHVAAREGHVEAVRTLLDAGAKVSETDASPETDHRAGRSNGWTLLHLAAMAGKTSTAELLLDRGADVNAADARGKLTPLHYAAWQGDAGLVRLLLARKADRSAKDEQGRTPLDLARERKHAAVIKLLE